MIKFRVTFLAISGILLFLGVSDLDLWWHNRTPTQASAATLINQGPPAEWLKISDGYFDIDRAISTTGTIELEALLVPLLTEPGQTDIHVLVETRHPRTLELVNGYHFLPETEEEQIAFRKANEAEFMAQREFTGMLVSGLIAKGNRTKLLDLARETGLKIDNDVIFISEGKIPQLWRGLFFTIVALLTILRVFWPGKKNNKKG